jgi:glucodextranase-like protein
MPKTLLFDMRGSGQKSILFLALLILAAGCTRLDNDSNTPIPPVPGATLPPLNGLPTAGTLNPPLPTNTAPTPSGSGPLTLVVLSPQDGSTVNVPEVIVRGTSTPGAVVTVNDDILIVGDDGQFQSRVLLEQGPNLIEIVASNDVGDEQSVELGIVYQP